MRSFHIYCYPMGNYYAYMVDLFVLWCQIIVITTTRERFSVEIITRIDAAKAGFKRYYTGKPCKHGHSSERWVYNGHCVACTMETNRRRHAEIKQIMAEAEERKVPGVI